MSELEARSSIASGSSCSGVDSLVKEVPINDYRFRILKLAALHSELKELQQQQNNILSKLEQLLDKHQRSKEQQQQLGTISSRAQAAAGQAQHLTQQIVQVKQKAILSKRILLAQAAALEKGGAALKAALLRLRDAELLLEGPEGTGRFRYLRDALIRRRGRMLQQLTHIFQIGPQIVSEVPNGGLLEERMDMMWMTGVDLGSSDGESMASGDSMALSACSSWRDGSTIPRTREVAKMMICDLELPNWVGRKDRDTAPNEWRDVHISAALGFVAQVVSRLALYLDVPLRYPLHCANSKSYIADQHPTLAIPSSSGGEQGEGGEVYVLGGDSFWQPHSTGPLRKYERRHDQTPIRYPLFTEGMERQFQIGTYLLSKDIEQLLASHGLRPDRHLLDNLYTLLSAGAAALT